MSGARVFAVALGVVLLADLACTSKLSLDGRACPCTSDYVCCEETNICVEYGSYDTKDPKACAALTGGTKTGKTSSTRPRALEEAEVNAGDQIAVASGPTCFTSDDDALYWMNRNGSLGALRLSTGAPIVIRPFLVPAAIISGCGLSRAGGYLFATLEKANSVLRLSVRTDASGGISVGDTADRLGTFEEPVALAALDENTLFVAEHTKKKLTRFDVATGATVDLVAGTDAIDALQISNGALFWTEEGGVVTRPTEPGSAIAWLSTESAPSNLRVRDGRVYFLAQRALWSAPIDAQAAPRRETGFDGNSATPNSGLLSVDAFAFDGPTVIAFNNRTVYETSFTGAEPKALFEVTSSTAEEPLFFMVDAKRYLWATTTGIWSASRPITPER